ncbi:MAG TPA: SGNH/GDSL hydrolase family protein [Chitinophagales bacterium]|nr:SGNH/GDSL hydrolase family protein [Chitinophagales bacterium]
MQQKVKKGICYLAIALLFLLSLYYLPLLYFGCASFKTTILVYVILLGGAIALVDLLNHRLGFSVNPNIKVLILSTGICLLCGEYALRFVFKKHLTYTELNDKPYISSYTLVYDWGSIRQYLIGNKNYWYLTNQPGSVWIASIDGHTFTHRQNALGFREEEKQPQSDDPQHLIIGIGDSFAEGIGATGDSTWLQLMADNLNTDSACHVRTYNAGISGSDVYFEYLVLDSLLQTYQPNTVVLGINTSDIHDIVIKGGRNRFKPGGKLKYNSPPWWEPLYAVSFLFRAVVHGSTKLHWTLLTVEEEAVKNKQAIDSIETAIYRFNSLVKQHRAKLLVVLHPREHEVVSGNFPFDILAGKLAADTSLHVINMQKEFARTGLITKQNSSDYFWKNDLHHNADGYRVMGTIIAGYIREKGLVCSAHK